MSSDISPALVKRGYGVVRAAVCEAYTIYEADGASVPVLYFNFFDYNNYPPTSRDAGAVLRTELEASGLTPLEKMAWKGLVSRRVTASLVQEFPTIEHHWKSQLVGEGDNMKLVRLFSPMPAEGSDSGIVRIPPATDSS